MHFVFLIAWLIGLIALHRFARALFPYAVFLSLLAFLNLLPVIDENLTDIRHMNKVVWVALGGVFLLLYSVRHAFYAVLMLLALHFAGLLWPIQAAAYQATGFNRWARVDRFICLPQIKKSTARLYQVTYLETNLTQLVLAGENEQGNPVICGSTRHSFPVLGTYAVNLRKQLDFGDDRVLNSTIEHPELIRGHWTGYGTLGFIPSVRGTSFRFPIRIDEGYLSLPTGTFKGDSVTITAIK